MLIPITVEGSPAIVSMKAALHSVEEAAPGKQYVKEEKDENKAAKA